MIDDTLAKIEARIRTTSSLKDDNKHELLNLLAQLKSEVGTLSETHADEAQSIAGFAQVSAHEATRETKNPQRLQLAIDGLTSSVEGVETSHPRLVQIVNSICNALSNLGI